MKYIKKLLASRTHVVILIYSTWLVTDNRSKYSCVCGQNWKETSHLVRLIAIKAPLYSPRVSLPATFVHVKKFPHYILCDVLHQLLLFKPCQEVLKRGHFRVTARCSFLCRRFWIWPLGSCTNRWRCAWCSRGSIWTRPNRCSRSRPFPPDRRRSPAAGSPACAPDAHQDLK